MKYRVISDADDKLVWDAELSLMYKWNADTQAYDLTRATSLHSWLKFNPYAEDDGTTDTFPGRISGDHL